MARRDAFSFAEYAKGLPFRMALFAFMGMGWDVFMTLVQKLMASPSPGFEPACACIIQLDRSAICPASAWMYLAYGGIPLLVYPVTQLGKRLGLPYIGRALLVLAVFYAVEYGFGRATRGIGVVAWDYRWFLSEKWSLDGIVCWHPVIVIQWFTFCGLIELVDDGLRRGHGAFRAALREAWQER